MKKEAKSQEEPVLKELKNIRNLLMLLCTKSGALNTEVAKAVSMTSGRVSQLIAVKTKKVKK